MSDDHDQEMNMYDYDQEMEMLLACNNEWPNQPEFMLQLEVIASSALNRNDLEGAISSVLIYQQIVEDMVNILIADCQLLIADVSVVEPMY